MYIPLAPCYIPTDTVVCSQFQQQNSVFVARAVFIPEDLTYFDPVKGTPWAVEGDPILDESPAYRVDRPEGQLRPQVEAKFAAKSECVPKSLSF